MSPVQVLRRDDPAMFPVSYSYPAPSPSISPAFVELSRPGLDFDASTISPSTSSSPRITYTFDASTIIIWLSFLLFTLWTVAIFLFAPSWRRQFLEWRATKKQARKAKIQKQIQGLGFGYDGLTQAELQELQKQEEEDAGRLPRYPPSLSAISPLPPITIPGHDESEAIRHVESDPAPVYERGNYDSTESDAKDVI